MSFRDDREAAHQRADALEQELKQAQAEVARLRGPQREGRAARGRVAIVAAAAVLLVAGGAGFWVAVKRAPAPPVDQESVSGRAERIAGENSMAQYRAREAERALRAQQEAEQAAAAAAAVPPAPGVPIVWRGRVDTSTDPNVVAGAPCTVEGSFAPTRGSVEARSFRVECGGVMVYDETAAGGARINLREGSVAGSEAHEYMLSYSDAPHPGQAASIEVSTLRHLVTVTREGDDARVVTLYLRDVSDPRTGEPLIGRATTRQPSFAGVVERAARVTAVRGRGPVAVGARCEFAVRPVWEFPESCRMALRCGTTWVYGASESGYLTCEVQGGHPVAALDENGTDHGGDPRVTWRGRRVTVSDFTEAGEWSVDFAL